MARQSSLKGRLKKILRRYKKISPKRFLYNDRRALKQSYKHIRAWFLIHDDTLGYSIMMVAFRRKESYHVESWTEAFNAAGFVGTESLFRIYTTRILPAINAKGGNHWRFKSLIGWSGDLPKIKNSDLSTKSKPSKARRGKRNH